MTPRRAAGAGVGGAGRAGAAAGGAGAAAGGEPALTVIGSDRDTTRVAAGLGLPALTGPSRTPMIVVASSPSDVATLRDVVRGGIDNEAPPIAAVVALRLEEDLVVALYDLGLPVAFGFCSRAAIEAAIEAAPDAEARSVAASLASLERVLSQPPSPPPAQPLPQLLPQLPRTGGSS